MMEATAAVFGQVTNNPSMLSHGIALNNAIAGISMNPNLMSNQMISNNISNNHINP